MSNSPLVHHFQVDQCARQ